MSEVIKDRASHPFRHHLSRLMHWRCTAPGQVEPYPPEQRSHLKSIYDTLLLRIMIDQIVYSSTGDIRREENPGSPSHHLPMDATARSSASGTMRHGTSLEEADLYTTCQAVVSSLTRATMRDRNFLPWLTGYSAFSAALVLLYLRAKAHSKSPSSRLQPPEQYPIGHFTASTPDSAWFSGAHEEDPLRDAVAVMAIVSRQFTRVAKYKASVVKLRDLISSPALAKDNVQVDMAEMIDDFGPEHLRHLLNITLSWICRPEICRQLTTTPGAMR
jgi:hypothetical protein